MKIEFLRNCELSIANILLASESMELVPKEQYDKVATYYIFGGLVFRPLTKNYLKLSGEEWIYDAPTQLLNFLYEYPDTKDQEIINLVSVLPHQMNNGYHSFSDVIITEVNGHKINNLEEMIKIIEEDVTSPYVELKTIDHKLIVLDRELAEANKDEILKTYSIPKDRSIDLIQ